MPTTDGLQFTRALASRSARVAVAGALLLMASACRQQARGTPASPPQPSNGHAASASTTTTTAPTPSRGPGQLLAQQISLGPRFHCARTTDDHVACWGTAEGQWLVPGLPEPARVPQPIAGIDEVEQVAVGWGHACARRRDQTLWCWGDNTRGQLGDGTTASRAQPRQVPNMGGVRALAAGHHHNCVLAGTHDVWCWGGNADGQVGNNSRGDRPTPTLVPILASPDVRHLHASGNDTCVVSTIGAVYCWGAMRWATSALFPTPFPVGGRPVDDVVMADTWFCARRESGLFCRQAGDAAGLTEYPALNSQSRSEPMLSGGIDGVCQLMVGEQVRCLGAGYRESVAPGAIGIPRYRTMQDAVQFEVNNGECYLADDHTVWCRGWSPPSGQPEVRDGFARLAWE